MATIKVSQDTLEEWAAVLSAVKDSATPALAERLAQMITALGQLAQRATEPAALETVDLLVTRQQTLQTVLDQLEQWRQDGTWTALTEFTALLAGIKNSASAPLAERLGTLAAQLGDLVGSATDPAAQALLTHALDHEPALSATVRQLAEWHQDGTWTAMTEFAALLAGIKNSASAPLAERLGTLAAQLGPVVTRLTDAETLSTLDQVLDQQATLRVLLDQLSRWQQDGTWDAVTNLMGLARALQDSLNPLMIERLMTTGTQLGTLVNQLLTDGVAEAALGALRQLGDAQAEARTDPRRVTLGSLLRVIKDPEMQTGIKTLIGFLRRLPAILEPLL